MCTHVRTICTYVCEFEHLCAHGGGGGGGGTHAGAEYIHTCNKLGYNLTTHILYALKKFRTAQHLLVLRIRIYVNKRTCTLLPYIHVRTYVCLYVHTVCVRTYMPVACEQMYVWDTPKEVPAPQASLSGIGRQCLAVPQIYCSV